MPVLDGSFEAFVTNLGKYNEGELVGEWKSSSGMRNRVSRIC